MQKIKKLYDYDQVHDLVLYNNREILIDRSSFYYQNWHQGGILSIHDLLLYLPVYKLNPPFWRHFSVIKKILEEIQKTLILSSQELFFRRYGLINQIHAEQVSKDSHAMS